MQFCIRDDDTSFFTSPDELERAYGEVTKWGPVSLAIIPFCRAGTSKGIPEKFRGRWSIHPFHTNTELVEFLRSEIAAGRYEPMLHGYHHDEPDGSREFAQGINLAQKVTDGRKYLEDVLGAPVRVFVPPHNAIRREGLHAVAREGLHLGGVAGVRGGWTPFSVATWANWMRLRRWRVNGGAGIPWVLDLGDHREIAGVPITPLSTLRESEGIFETARAMNGVFCAATHYWELDALGRNGEGLTVGQHLRRLVERAVSTSQVLWRSVGEVLAKAS